MTKKQVDKIVELLIEESRESGRRMSREEVEKWTGEGYSKGQKDRIFQRYCYSAERQFLRRW